MSTITPRTETPDLDFATVDGDTWRLADLQPKNFTMIVVYRGRTARFAKIICAIWIV